MASLDGRVAIVTGAAHGERAAIGSHFAKALAAEGAKVACADVKDCASVVAEITHAGGEAVALAVDVRDERSIEAMVAATLERWGRLDVLVNNAAIGSNIPPVPVGELSAAAWDELMAVNVRGPFLCVKAALPAMTAAGYGKVVNVGSATMFGGLPNRLHYVTAKGAIYAMTRALARELGPSGIRVNTIAYGLVTTPLTEAEMNAHPEKRAAIIGARSLGADIVPGDLAGTLVYLAAPESDAMTGQCLVVDGGDIFN